MADERRRPRVAGLATRDSPISDQCRRRSSPCSRLGPETRRKTDELAQDHGPASDAHGRALHWLSSNLLSQRQIVVFRAEGLSVAEQWVGSSLTAVLVVLTAVYVWQTGRIAKKTADSAESSRLASEAALSAAEAAERSATIAEASLRLRFTIKPSRHSDGLVWFTIRAKGATVWLHGAAVDIGHVTRSNGLFEDIAAAELVHPHGDPLPLLLRRGKAGVSLQWPVPQYRADDQSISVRIIVRYSYGRTDEAKSERVWAIQPKDLIDDWNRETRYFLDHGSARPAVGPPTERH